MGFRLEDRKSDEAEPTLTMNQLDAVITDKTCSVFMVLLFLVWTLNTEIQ
jgi:hypothetical protein